MGRVDAQPSAGLEAERAVLGAMLIDESIVSQVLAEVDERDFTSTANRLIFQAAREVFREGGHADAITINAKLGYASGSPQQQQLIDLMEVTPTSARGRDLHQVDELLLLRRAGGIAELRVDRDGVGVPALAEHLARRLEDQPVGCAGEVALVHLGEHLTDDALVDQHRAEHGALGFQTGARLRVYSAHVHPPS